MSLGKAMSGQLGKKSEKIGASKGPKKNNATKFFPPQKVGKVGGHQLVVSKQGPLKRK